MLRTSSRTRSRLACAGLTAGAVVAAVVVAPPAAWAVATASPSVAPIGATVTLTENGVFTGTTFGVQLRVDACAATFTTPTTAILSATGVAKVDNNSITFVVPTVPLTATTGAARAYNVCIYNGTAAGVSTSVTTSGLTVTATPAVSPVSGASGGGNTVTVTAAATTPIFTNVTTPGAVFSSTSCPTTYGSPTAGTFSSTVTRTSTTVASVAVPTGVLGTGTAATPYNLCLYAGTASNSALLASTTYSVTLPAVTLSSAIGSSAGGQGITATSAAQVLTGVTTPGVTFVTTARCPSTFTAAGPITVGGVSGTNVAAPGARKLANNRLAVTVPALALTNSAPTVYQMCVYAGTTAGTSPIVGVAAYTSTTVPQATAVTPNAGPALGGSTITVTGTDFPTAPGSITATLGGTPLTDITPVSSTSFTATTPAHAVGTVSLVITTAGGSSTLQAAYTYRNAIRVSPNTAPNTSSAVNVAVQGVGFTDLTTEFISGNASVLLVDGVYDPAPSSYNAAIRTNGAVAECVDVLVIGDTELVCTLQLNRRLTEAGTLVDFTATRNLTALATDTGSNIVESPAGAFSAADVGRPIVESGNTNIPANTTITAVLSPSRALISADALGTATNVAATVGGPQRAPFSATTTAGGTTVTGVAGNFSAADIGRGITGSTIPANTTIVDVNSTGSVATVSAATTAGTGNVTLYTSPAVPDGAYNLTVVNDDQLDAAAQNADYEASVVSSGSTFTVAPF